MVVNAGKQTAEFTAVSVFTPSVSLLPGNFGCVFSECVLVPVTFRLCVQRVNKKQKRNAFVGLKSKFAELLFVTLTISLRMLNVS